jgi:hypothetical protein
MNEKMFTQPSEEKIALTRPSLNEMYPGRVINAKKCFGVTKWRWKEIYGKGYPKFFGSLAIIAAMLWYLPLTPITLAVICVIGFVGGIGLGGALVHNWVYKEVDRPLSVLVKPMNEWKGWGGNDRPIKMKE